MTEWQSLLQSVFIGLIFSYLLAKLISVVVSFKEDKLSFARHCDSSAAVVEVVRKPPLKAPVNPRGPEAASDRLETESTIAEIGSVRNESLPCSDVERSSDDDDDDDDDWEGVESTELDEIFSAATAFIAASAASSSQKVSTDVQLQLYALYKIATEGPCTGPQPSALKMTARAKWYIFLRT